ncbi:GntR family transcriptional repressor for pyruvate dehydrogenase complex [Rhizobium petrolearium]|uniref:FadR/GntR family transcriptional regulator n=1 Tax=Neorhizobium petrolearium TaxID=515361 RepID=UPI001AE8546F|nr:FCD domain-containing protein [Neorhizobium petrolearium]MBP1845517.1 GntR family transcriptional repressor for pyruvate dehydrogenase complex [Neorhizobium petrolearium]
MLSMPREMPAERTKRSVPVRVAEAIQRVIAEEKLKTGDKIPSERLLAVMLNASRASVREGISMLETLGLLQVEVGRGAFVAEPKTFSPLDRWRFSTGYSLQEVYEYRRTVEPVALAMAASRFSQEDIAALRASAEALASHARTGNSVKAAEQDTLFHAMIYDHCGNRIFQEIHDRMGEAIRSSQWVPMVILEMMTDTAREHMRIVEALEAKDITGACAALVAHIDAAAHRCGI